MMEWQPEQIDMVRSLVAEKLTAAQIGAKLGVTRNAIIGICHRRGIALNKPAQQYTKTGLLIERKPTKVSGSRRLLLLDLKRSHCRYPDDDRDARTGQHTFCGRTKRNGYSYCAEHAARCHRPAPKPSDRRSM